MTRAAPASDRRRDKGRRAPRGSLVAEMEHAHRFTLTVLVAMLLVSLVSSGYLLFYCQPRLSGYVEVTRQARDAHDAMLDQETGLRGWLATGDRVFLEPFVAGRRTARSSLRSLLDSVHDDPEVSDAVGAMLRARDSWNVWAERAADTRVAQPARDSDELSAFLLEGKRLFDAYRAAEARSTDLLRGRRSSALAHERLALVLVLLTYLAVLGSTGVLAVRRRRALTQTVVAPIEALLGAIESIREGDLRTRSTHTGVRELDEIGSALDNLAGELDRARIDAGVREGRLAYLASRFETIVRVGREITGSLNVRYVSDTVTTAAAELLQAPTVLWSRGADGGFVATRRSRDPRGSMPPGDLVAPGAVLAAAAEARVCAGVGHRAYPLVLGRDVVGVLEAATTRVDNETDQVLEALLSTASAALESAHLHSTTRELAEMDALTQLPNRRRFDSDVDAEWERCLRYGGPLSLVMLDLDHFKRLNDGHGHLLGDRVLQAVAAAIASVLRTSDTAYRYGGEEIVVLLRETRLGEAIGVAERVRAVVAATRISGHPDVAVSCSAGVAERGAGMAHHTDLVAAADAALYAAKRAGRDRVAPSLGAADVAS